MNQLMLTLNLQLFSDDVAVDSGVEDVPAAEGQEIADPSGVDNQAAAEPDQQNNFEKAFAKRLAAKEAEWESKYKELEGKYQDYDVSKKALDYLMRTNNISDPMTLKEQIELTELQERAEQQNLPPEFLKRLEELESKAAKADAFEQQQAEEKQRTEFETSLKSFCEGKMIGDKPLSHMELWQYMHQEQIGKPEAAYKAMKADLLEQQLETAKKEGVKEFLAAKGSIPKVEGTAKSGVTPSATPKNFAEARARAMQRFNQ